EDHPGIEHPGVELTAVREGDAVALEELPADLHRLLAGRRDAEGLGETPRRIDREDQRAPPPSRRGEGHRGRTRGLADAAGAAHDDDALLLDELPQLHGPASAASTWAMIRFGSLSFNSET